jgi:hypothetical protein
MGADHLANVVALERADTISISDKSECCSIATMATPAARRLSKNASNVDDGPGGFDSLSVMVCNHAHLSIGRCFVGPALGTSYNFVCVAHQL